MKAVFIATTRCLAALSLSALVSVLTGCAAVDTIAKVDWYAAEAARLARSAK